LIDEIALVGHQCMPTAVCNHTVLTVSHGGQRKMMCV